MKDIQQRQRNKIKIITKNYTENWRFKPLVTYPGFYLLYTLIVREHGCHLTINNNTSTTLPDRELQHLGKKIQKFIIIMIKDKHKT